MSYNAATLAQEAVFNTSPNGSHNGVWMSGGGAAADANGNIYFATGNGTWNGTTDYGDSIVKLGPPANGNFPVIDYFTPYNQAMLANDDTDLASGGLVLLPALPSGQQLLAQQGKQGTIYLLDITNLGKYCINLTPGLHQQRYANRERDHGGQSRHLGVTRILERQSVLDGGERSASRPIRSMPTIAASSRRRRLRTARRFSPSRPLPPPFPRTATRTEFFGHWTAARDDSTCDGGGSNCLGLYAYDATNLANLLYTSSQAANNRDSPGTAVKFEKPIIANGKVYVGTQSSVTRVRTTCKRTSGSLDPDAEPGTRVLLFRTIDHSFG